jgi:cytochrome P450
MATPLSRSGSTNAFSLDKAYTELLKKPARWPIGAFKGSIAGERMSTIAPEASQHVVPDHVPAHLVKTFDFHTGLGNRPQEAIGKLLDGPPIFYSPVRHTFGPGGAWVVVGSDLVKAVTSDPETYSSTELGTFLAHFGEDFILAPLAIDPPRHTRFRALINPLFTPARMVALAPKIESWCNELIDRFEEKGRCNFIQEFADQFPTGIFIDLMGLQRDRVVEFVNWVRDFIHGETNEIRMSGVQRTVDFFDTVFQNPQDYPEGSMIRYLRDAEPEGRPMSRGEFIGTAFLLFTAGLDTVVSSLGFIFRMLAEDQALQAHLRDKPAEIPRHVEEMMRLFAPVTPQRRAMRDGNIGGVQIKQGDVLALCLTGASRDPSVFSEPDKLDPSRNPNPHFAFSTGIHRCAGAQLARRDLAIAVEIWLKRISPFRIAKDSAITASGGSVLVLDGIVLEWDR